MGNALRVPTIKVDWDKNLRGEDRDRVRIREESEQWSNWTAYYFVVAVFNALLISVLVGRCTEIVPMVLMSPIHLTMTVFLCVTSLSFLFMPARTFQKAFRRLLIIAMLARQIKVQIDSELCYGQISKSEMDGGRYNLEGQVAIVTGANSGVGFGTTKHLVSYGATVVMACRSMDKCEGAKLEIELELSTKIGVGTLKTMKLDLSDFASIEEFSLQFPKRFDRLDILVNNAGAIPAPGAKTKDGLELSLGAMHFGHFALTKWLLPFMLKSRPKGNLGDMDIPQRNKGHSVQRDLAEKRSAETGSQYISGTNVEDGAARIVFTTSDAMNWGSFHTSLLFDSAGSEVAEYSFSDFESVGGTGGGDMNGEITDNCGLCNPLGSVPYVGKYLAMLPDFCPCCPVGSCPYTNSYSRAKLANVLMAQELQLRYNAYAYASGGSAKGLRRLVTAAVHPGMVQANIASFFANPLTNWFMRTPDEAGRLLVYAALENSFIPGSFVDAMGQSADLVGLRTDNRGLDMHAAAFPEVKKMLFYAEAVHYSYQVPYIMQAEAWKHRTLLFPPPALNGSADEDTLLQQKREIREIVSARLWEVSEGVVQAYKEKKPLFKRNIDQQDSKLL